MRLIEFLSPPPSGEMQGAQRPTRRKTCGNLVRKGMDRGREAELETRMAGLAESPPSGISAAPAHGNTGPPDGTRNFWNNATCRCLENGHHLKGRRREHDPDCSISRVKSLYIQIQNFLRGSHAPLNSRVNGKSDDFSVNSNVYSVP